MCVRDNRPDTHRSCERISREDAIIFGTNYFHLGAVPVSNCRAAFLSAPESPEASPPNCRQSQLWWTRAQVTTPYATGIFERAAVCEKESIIRLLLCVSRRCLRIQICSDMSTQGKVVVVKLPFLFLLETAVHLDCFRTQDTEKYISISAVAVRSNVKPPGPTKSHMVRVNRMDEVVLFYQIQITEMRSTGSIDFSLAEKIVPNNGSWGTTAAVSIPRLVARVGPPHSPRVSDYSGTDRMAVRGSDPTYKWFSRFWMLFTSDEQCETCSFHSTCPLSNAAIEHSEKIMAT